MRKSILLITTFISFISFGQKKKTTPQGNEDSVLLSKVKYRLVGPFRGGRSAAVTGSYKNRN
ncbi:MAG TPA: hypothetical protein VNS32_14280, partial [Flavisolibacter sp.]|nr:hypothetical protein [Flavisolibacter sp.]